MLSLGPAPHLDTQLPSSAGRDPGTCFSDHPWVSTLTSEAEKERPAINSTPPIRRPSSCAGSSHLNGQEKGVSEGQAPKERGRVGMGHWDRVQWAGQCQLLGLPQGSAWVLPFKNP